MGSSLDQHGRSRGMRRWAQRGVTAALILCLANALGGCGSKAKRPGAGGAEKSETSQKATTHAEGGAKAARTGEKSAPKTSSKAAEKPAEKPATKSASKSAEKSAEKPAAKSAAKSAEKPAEKPAPKAAAVSGGGSIRLVDRGCVSFEPHWTTIRVGQSLTWHSELKTAVTIHVPPGAFERSEYVVPARGTVRSGPAQNPGDHGMWSMPAACQAAPIGVQGAGPGVTIEER